MTVWMLQPTDPRDAERFQTMSCVALRGPKRDLSKPRRRSPKTVEDPSLDTLVSGVDIGDMVLLEQSSGEAFDIGWVMGRYWYLPDGESALRHRRLVKWLGRRTRDQLGRGELGRQRMKDLAIVSEVASVDDTVLRLLLRP